jgi:hypothetical protein
MYVTCIHFMNGYRLNLHLQNVSVGWGSGRAKTHSTLIAGSISRAKFTNSPRCISLQTYSESPRFNLASYVGHLGTVMITSSGFSSISYLTMTAQG